MAYLLRFLISLMMVSVGLTFLVANHKIDLPFSHIQLAIPTLLFMIFVQAFVMFYFIGVSRLTNNLYAVLNTPAHLHELFDNPPADLSPYLKKVERYVHNSNLWKRQTIPWTMLILTLGIAAFLLGGAHDTGLVSKTVHVGLVYGFSMALVIGFIRQWHFLGKGHLLLREMKTLFEIPDHSM